MRAPLDVYPARSGSLVDVIIHNRTANWRDLLTSSIPDTHRIRIFTDPLRRVKQIKSFYYMVRRVYPELSVEALDYAFEMYLLGWIDSYQLLSVARNYMSSDNCIF